MNKKIKEAFKENFPNDTNFRYGNWKLGRTLFMPREGLIPAFSLFFGLIFVLLLAIVFYVVFTYWRII